MKQNNPNSIEVNESPKNYNSESPPKPKNKSNLLKLKQGLLSRSLIFILIFCYLSNKLQKNFNLIFGNIPLFTFYKFEIYRSITDSFICNSFSELIIGILMISSVVNNFENKEGTILFFLQYIFNLFISQLFLVIFYLIIQKLNPIFISYRLHSREFICCSFLVKHLLTTNNKKIGCLLCGEINDRFLIVFFLLMYFFINEEYRIENIFCLYYGFLMCKYKNFFNLESLTQNKIINIIEMSEFGKIFKIFECFISFQKSHLVGKNSNSNLFSNIKNNDIDENIKMKSNYDYEHKEFNV